jgi:hypothetical protein
MCLYRDLGHCPGQQWALSAGSSVPLGDSEKVDLVAKGTEQVDMWATGPALGLAPAHRLA